MQGGIRHLSRTKIGTQQFKALRFLLVQLAKKIQRVASVQLVSVILSGQRNKELYFSCLTLQLVIITIDFANSGSLLLWMHELVLT